MDPMQSDDRQNQSNLEQQIEELRAQVANLREAANDRAAQAYEVVKDNPGTSMLVAAGLAVVIGFVLGQQTESERHRHQQYRFPWQ